MDNAPIEVTIDGTKYYIDSDRVEDIQYIDGKLVNVSNSSITLISSWGPTQNYPYITCSSMRQCVYYNGSYQGSAVTAEMTYNKNTLSALSSRDISLSILFILICILGVRLLWKH